MPINEINELRENNVSYKKIALMYDCCSLTVVKKIKEENLKKKYLEQFLFVVQKIADNQLNNDSNIMYKDDEKTIDVLIKKDNLK